MTYKEIDDMEKSDNDEGWSFADLIQTSANEAAKNLESRENQ